MVDGMQANGHEDGKRDSNGSDAYDDELYTPPPPMLVWTVYIHTYTHTISSKNYNKGLIIFPISSSKLPERVNTFFPISSSKLSERVNILTFLFKGQ